MSDPTFFGNVLQGAFKLRYPWNFCSKCRQIFVSSAKVVFEKTVPELYIGRITIGVGADVPKERILWKVVLKIPARPRTEETRVGYLPGNLTIELSSWIAKRNYLMPNRIFGKFLAIHDFLPRLMHREVMQTYMMQGVAADFKLLVDFSNLPGVHDLPFFIRPGNVEGRLQSVFVEQIDGAEIARISVVNANRYKFLVTARRDGLWILFCRIRFH